MAESKNQIPTCEIFQEVQQPKKGRNFSNRTVERIRKRLTKSPKRAGTPEPEQWTLTDDSEKDLSEGENIKKKNVNEEVESQNISRKRFIINKVKRDLNRSRSLENTLARESDSDDDFEMIRSLHKSKEQEEEKKEAEKLVEDSKPKSKEELKQIVQKEMPPLIMAPKDSKKRKRHKSLPLQEDLNVQEKSKTPILKSKKLIIKSKTSVSEDEDFPSSRRSSTTLPPDELSKLRSRKTVKTKVKEIKVSGDDSINEKLITEDKRDEVDTSSEKKLWFYQRWFLRGKASRKKIEEDKLLKIENKQSKVGKIQSEANVRNSDRNRWILKEIFYEWRLHVHENKEYCRRCQKLKNRCLVDLIILLIFCGFGGIIFRFTEGAFESFYKCGVKRVKRDFIETLWKNSQYMLEDDWKSNARRKLMDFENQLHSAHEAGMTSYSGQKSWSFLNAVVYCLTVVTTIGYGHISPSTTTGRAITIIYAIFGIPMFLILLADFGKLFTRGIKFLWAFVRRLYYTGSCRKVRKTAPVQEVMKGVQIMYDFAKTRRLTIAGGMEGQEHHLRPPDHIIQGVPDTPSTPNWSVYEIDDEFNLPISIAISILLTYIFFGAFLYWMWEDWSFFESFYFVFISMSTIGFGDFVPQHPIYMMLSIVYLIFGLALTSMCINVVQEKLSDTFRQASAKLGTTMGLNVEESVSAKMEPKIEEKSSSEYHN